MGRDRNPLLSIFAVVVYVFLFAPIVVLILFSFNDSKRNFVWRGFTLKWYPELVRERGAPARAGGHPPGRGDRRRGHDHPRDAPGPGPGAPAVRGRGGHLRHADPAADGDPRDRDGHQPAAVLRAAVQRQRVDLADRDRPHRLLDLLRGDHRARPGRLARPADGGGRPRPRRGSARRVLPRHAAADRAGRGGRGADRLRAVVRRPDHHLVQRRRRLDHPAALHLLAHQVRRHPRDQRDLHDRRRRHRVLILVAMRFGAIRGGARRLDRV